MAFSLPTPTHSAPDEDRAITTGTGTRGGAIHYDHVSKVYGEAGVPAVHDVTLDVEPGKLVVLLGPSGCGKTTLLKLTNRLFEPTSGRITIDGEDTASLPGPQLRRRIGYVIQQTGLFPHQRIAENIAVVPKLLHWDKRRIERRVDELLELVGLPPDQYRDRYPAQLSGGQQQRVGLARALAAEPHIMLMDEPFGALDAITRTRLQDELLRIHRQMQQTIVFVTHDIEEAVRLADKIVVMRKGRVVQYDTPLNIVMEPADQFVADLVGADDVMRRLNLLPISAATRFFDERERAALPHLTATDLSLPQSAVVRDALSLLLERNAESLYVVDQDGQPIGMVTLDTIQAVSGHPAEHSENAPVPSEYRSIPSV